MAERGWGRGVTIAIGVAAAAGAAQLGFGYGLGIITWVPATDRAGETAWAAGLAWATWIAATSTVAGAVCAYRLTRAPAGADRTGPADAGSVDAGSVDAGSVDAGSVDTASAGEELAEAASAGGGLDPLRRIGLCLAGAIGALVTVALVAVPARAATRTETFSPQTIAAGYAVLGVLVGLGMAIWALSSPAVATDIIGTVGWLWLLALVAVVDGVVSGNGLTGAQLGVWQLTSDGERYWFRDYFYWPGAVLSLGSALIIGAVAARTTARDPGRRVGAAISGMAGPALVAIAYFLAVPNLSEIRAEQLSAHLMAPYAVVAGVLGSALMAGLAQRSDLVGTPAGTESGRSGGAAERSVDSQRDGSAARIPGQRNRRRTDNSSDVPAAGSSQASQASQASAELGTPEPGAGEAVARGKDPKAPTEENVTGSDDAAASGPGRRGGRRRSR